MTDNESSSTTCMTAQPKAQGAGSAPPRRAPGCGKVATWWPENLTLAEVLYLLCADPTPACPGFLAYLGRDPVVCRAGLQAAAVAELVLAGNVTLRQETPDNASSDSVWAEVVDGAWTTDRILGTALSTLIDHGARSKPVDLAGDRLGRLFGTAERSWELVPRCLAAKRIVREDRAWVWGFLPVNLFPVVDHAGQKRLRQAFSAAVRSTKRPSNRLAAMIAIAHSCDALGKLLTISLQGRRYWDVVERARTNVLGGPLAHMLRVATYEPPEMHAGLLAS